MKALLQRVSAASVTVEGETIAGIGRGLLIFLGVEPTDTEAQAGRLAERLLGYRVFGDANGQMNLSVTEVEGELLLVSQFTLAADTRSGRRPGFSTAAAPAVAEPLYEHMKSRLAASGLKVASGRFGADMQVTLINDGPVTFLLQA